MIGDRWMGSVPLVGVSKNIWLVASSKKPKLWTLECEVSTAQNLFFLLGGGGKT